MREREVTDTLAELLISTVHRINAHAEKYGGRGVLIYWHVEKRSMVIHSQLISCAASEVAAMIEGAVRHGTTMQLEGNYVDSHGQSEIGVAITRLLDFELLSRIKQINKARLYRPDRGDPTPSPR